MHLYTFQSLSLSLYLCLCLRLYLYFEVEVDAAQPSRPIGHFLSAVAPADTFAQAPSPLLPVHPLSNAKCGKERRLHFVGCTLERRYSTMHTEEKKIPNNAHWREEDTQHTGNAVERTLSGAAHRVQAIAHFIACAG